MPATLCLLPGLLCDATVWADQWRDLGHDRDMFVPDFLGFDSITGMAEFVIESTKGPIDVAGHSMGGRVALEILRLAPERLARLALLDTGAHGPIAAEAPRRHALVERARQEGMTALIESRLHPMVHEDRLTDTALMQPLIDMVSRATPEAFAGQIKALLNRPDATAQLPAITCPTEVLVGRQDSWSPLQRHIEMAAVIPGANLTIVENSGHMVTVERPEVVTEALRKWLER